MRGMFYSEKIKLISESTWATLMKPGDLLRHFYYHITLRQRSLTADKTGWMLQRGALLYSNVSQSAKALNKTTKQILRTHRVYEIHISSWVIKSRDSLLCLSPAAKERLRRDGGGADDYLLDSAPCFIFFFRYICVSVFAVCISACASSWDSPSVITRLLWLRLLREHHLLTKHASFHGAHVPATKATFLRYRCLSWHMFFARVASDYWLAISNTPNTRLDHFQQTQLVCFPLAKQKVTAQFITECTTHQFIIEQVARDAKSGTETQ